MKQWKRTITQFLTAQTISLFGSSLVQYAIIWYITLSTSSGTMLMISTMCGFLPQIFISLFAGTWIDRFNRKYVMMITDSAIAGATAVLAITFFQGHRPLWLVFVVLAIRSAGTGIQTPAVNAVIPQLVPQHQLLRINGIYSTISSMTTLLSPAISGAILSIASIEITMCIDILTAIVGVAITAYTKIPKQNILVKSASMIEDMKHGLHYVKASKLLSLLFLYQLILLFLISPSAFLTPLMVARSFGNEIWRLTASEMTFSMGMVAGGLLISTWSGFPKQLKTTLIAGTIYGLLMIGLGSVPVFTVYLLCNTLIGITSPCYQAPITVYIQENVKPEMHGRMFSLMQIASSSALPMGMLLFGPLADHIDVQYLMIGCGGMVLLLSMLIKKHFITVSAR